MDRKRRKLLLRLISEDPPRPITQPHQATPTGVMAGFTKKSVVYDHPAHTGKRGKKPGRGAEQKQSVAEKVQGERGEGVHFFVGRGGDFAIIL